MSVWELNFVSEPWLSIADFGLLISNLTNVARFETRSLHSHIAYERPESLLPSFTGSFNPQSAFRNLQFKALVLGIDHRQRVGERNPLDLSVFGKLPERVLWLVRISLQHVVHVAHRQDHHLLRVQILLRNP